METTMRNQLLLGVCVLLLLGAGSAFAQPLSFSPAIQGGMGDVKNYRVTELAVMGGFLYAGVNNGATGAEVWRASIQGTTLGNDWVQVNADGFGEGSANDVIRAMRVFQGELYVGTGNTVAEVWKTAAVGGPPFSDWTKTGGNGFGAPANVRINSMAIHNSALFAGTRRFGCRVYRTPDGTTWTMVERSGFGNTSNEAATSMISFGGYLYVGTRNNSTGVEIWRTAEVGGPPFTDWTQVNTDGFGDPNNDHASSIAVFNGRLYIGTENLATGAEVWSTAGAGGPPFTDWTQANVDGFGDGNNTGAMAMVATGGHLLVGTANGAATTGQLWNMDMGGVWTRIALPAFAGNERIARLIAAPAVYFGTGNDTGGEVWEETASEPISTLGGWGIGLLVAVLGVLGIVAIRVLIRQQ